MMIKVFFKKTVCNIFTSIHLVFKLLQTHLYYDVTVGTRGSSMINKDRMRIRTEIKH